MDNKLSVHFEEDSKFIFFSIARGWREINVSFAGHLIEPHELVLGCQLDSKLRGEV